MIRNRINKTKTVSETTDSLTQGSEATESTAQAVGSLRSTVQGAASFCWTHNPETQCELTIRDYRVWRSSGSSRTPGRGWIPHGMSDTWWAHSRHCDIHVDRGAQLAGAGIVEVSAIDQVSGVGKGPRESLVNADGPPKEQ